MPPSDPRRDAHQVRRSQSKRVHAGRRFEESLERTHAMYRAGKVGKIVPHYPRTIRTPKGLTWAKGGAPMDFSGVVKPGGRRTCLRDELPHAVAFDAKVLREGRASYTHDAEQMHQLRELLDFNESGGLGFLLIQERERNCAIAVHGSNVLTHLLTRPKVPVVLREGDRFDWPTAPFGLRGYDWRELIPTLLDQTARDFRVLAKGDDE